MHKMIFKQLRLPEYGPDLSLTTTVDDFDDLPMATYEGEENPNYHLQIASRKDATTKLSATRITTRHAASPSFRSLYIGNPKVNSGVWAKDVIGATQTSAYIRTWNPPSFLSEARVAMQMRVYEEIVKVSTPTILSELRETIRMIKSPLKGLRSGVDDFARELTKRQQELSKPSSRERLADLWLEYSFGWAPLVREVESIMELYAGRLTSPRTIRVQNKFEVPVGISFLYNHGYNNVKWSSNEQIVGDVKIYHRGLVSRKPYVDYLPNQDLLGLNWAELVPTAWELVPWSFLVDYFVNIGDTFKANMVLSLVDTIYCSESVKTTLSSTYSSVPRSDVVSGYRTFVHPHQPVDLVSLATRETIQRNSYLLSPQVPSWTFRGDMSVARMCNIAALSQTAFKLTSRRPVL